MHKLGVYVRSKVPTSFSTSGYTNMSQDTIPLTPSNINYETNDELNACNADSYQSYNNHEDVSNNDLHSTFDSKVNKDHINEWQAAYNVTNAIQVIDSL